MNEKKRGSKYSYKLTRDRCGKYHICQWYSDVGWACIYDLNFAPRQKKYKKIGKTGSEGGVGIPVKEVDRLAKINYQNMFARAYHYEKD